MRTSKAGMWVVAILMVVTGAGSGIAQAGGTHSDRPVLSFEDQVRSQLAKSPSEDMQMEAPIETGAIPATGSDESWLQTYGQD